MLKSDCLNVRDKNKRQDPGSKGRVKGLVESETFIVELVCASLWQNSLADMLT